MKKPESCHANGNYNPNIWRVKISSEACTAGMERTSDVWAPKINPKSSHSGEVSRNSPSCPGKVDGCHSQWKPKQSLVSTSLVTGLNDKEFVIANGNPGEIKPLMLDKKELPISGPGNVDVCLKVWRPKKNLVSIIPVLDSNDREIIIANENPEDIKPLTSDRKEMPSCQKSIKQSSIGLSGELLPVEQERNPASVSNTLNQDEERRMNSDNGCFDDTCHMTIDKIIEPLNVKQNPELYDTSRYGSLKVWKVRCNSGSGQSCDDVNCEIWKLNVCPHKNKDESTRVREQNTNSISSLANVGDSHKTWKPKEHHLPANPSLKVMSGTSSTISGFECVKPKESETSVSLSYQSSVDEGFSTKTNAMKTERNGIEACHKLSKSDNSGISSYTKDVNIGANERHLKYSPAVEISEVWMPKKNPVSTGSTLNLDCNESVSSDGCPQHVKPLKSGSGALLPCHVSAQQSSKFLDEQLSANQTGKFASRNSMSSAEAKSGTHSESSNNSSDESCLVIEGGNLQVWCVNRNPESSLNFLDNELSVRQVRESAGSISISNVEVKNKTFSESSNINCPDESCFANRGENLEIGCVKRNPESSLNLPNEELSVNQVGKSTSRSGMPNDEVKSETYSESSNNTSSDESCFANRGRNVEVGCVRRHPKSYHFSVHDNSKVWKQKKNPVSVAPVERVSSKSVFSNGRDQESLLLSENSIFLSNPSSAKKSSTTGYDESADEGKTTSSSSTYSSIAEAGCEVNSSISGSDESSTAKVDEELVVGNVNGNDKRQVSCPVYMNRNSTVWKPKKSPVSVRSVSNVRNSLVFNGTAGAIKKSKSGMDATLRFQDPTSQSLAEAEAGNHKKLEDFLYDMLGHECQLDRTVIQEVLGHCGYDMKQSIHDLLDLAAKTLQPKQRLNQEIETTAGWNRTQKMNHCNGTRFANFNGFKDSEQCRDKFEQEEKVENTLLGIPDKTEGVEHCISSLSIAQDDEEVDEIYYTHRKAVAENRSLMKDYYQAAQEAFAKDDHAQGRILLEKGQFFYNKAREADEESAERTFQISGDDEDNQKEITLDLQNLRVKEAIRAVKCHLRALCGVGILRISIGSEDESSRESRKRKVTMFLDKESIKWREEDGNPWTILAHLGEMNPNQLSFV